MSTQKTLNKPALRKKTTANPLQKKLPLFAPIPQRSLEYFGLVNYATTERVIEEIRKFVIEDPYEEIYLTVTSAGGPTGTAMSFYDHMRSVLHPPLVTIGSGDVDSSGILIFLSGEKRYLTKNTTLLLHRAGRCFEPGTRFTAAEIEAMFREDNLKDYQYACVVAERSNGRLDTEMVLALMDKNTVLTPFEMITYGLADYIIE